MNETRLNGKELFLMIYLRCLSIFMFLMWGVTHLFFPRWYLEHVANKDPSVLTPDLVLAGKEIGVFSLVLSLAMFAISKRSWRHLPLVLAFCAIALGSTTVTVLNMLSLGQNNEWAHVIMTPLIILPLVILYPWKKAFYFFTGTKRTSTTPCGETELSNDPL